MASEGAPGAAAEGGPQSTADLTNFVRPPPLRRTRSRDATVPANRKSSLRPPPAAGAEATQARPP